MGSAKSSTVPISNYKYWLLLQFVLINLCIIPSANNVLAVSEGWFFSF